MPTPSNLEQYKANARQNLILATIAFAISFANWGLVAGLAPLLKKELGLSVTQASVMIAIPVLLGSIGRIPMGLLTDRFGGRLVFSILMALGLIPPFALALNYSYPSLLFWGLWLGLAGTSFAIGITFVSKWFPPDQLGTALGIYGTGNIGQSVAVFFGPVLAVQFGLQSTLIVFGLASLVWSAVFFLIARNAKTQGPPKTFAENIKVLRTEKLSWVLSLFYSLTFGGFVTLSVYLPTLYKESFSLSPTTAGLLTALFVILATSCRPIGGWLSDRLGGQNLLLFVFLGIFLLGWLMAIPSLIVFNIGVAASAILLGLGNGGVFKLVPEHFPANTGTVTGLVGAVGGLGGFFPPIELGILKDTLDSYALGFIAFSLFGLLCVLILNRTFMQTARPRQYHQTPQQFQQNLRHSM
jgi:MFS transporter, NNP family, nitrate/nitrite transporter